MKYKAIILVLASRGIPFDSFRVIWEKYCHNFPSVKTHFIYGQGEHENKFESDLIFENCPEEYPVPICKTIEAFKFVEANYDYEFLLRTNLSTFWNIPRFLKNLEELPLTNYYAGDGPLKLKKSFYHSEEYFSGTDTVVNKKTITDSLNYLKENDDFSYFLENSNPWAIPEDKAMGMMFDKANPEKSSRSERKSFIENITYGNLNNLKELVRKKIKEADSLNYDNFRVKNVSWLPPQVRRDIDSSVMNVLYEHYYVN